MGRILAIDLGLKRCGLAWTDALQLIAHNLGGCPRAELASRLDAYLAKEAIVVIVIGWPKGLNNEATDLTENAWQFGKEIKKKYPQLQVFLFDERFTSTLAAATLRLAGVSKSKRADKLKIDAISATILLQDFLAIWNSQNNTRLTEIKL
jgi:putative Holliday junction resolvase